MKNKIENKSNDRQYFTDRFLSKVEKGAGDECWEWTGCKRNRYGLFHMDGKLVSAHRTSKAWEMGLSGPDKIDLMVLHKCDNPGCVRPDHLFMGSNQDNMDDMLSKKRQSCRVGELNTRSRLSERDVRAIRVLDRMGVSRKQIKEMFGVSKTAIAQIIRRETWSHLS